MDLSKLSKIQDSSDSEESQGTKNEGFNPSEIIKWFKGRRYEEDFDITSDSSNSISISSKNKEDVENNPVLDFRVINDKDTNKIKFVPSSSYKEASLYKAKQSFDSINPLKENLESLMNRFVKWRDRVNSRNSELADKVLGFNPDKIEEWIKSQPNAESLRVNRYHNGRRVHVLSKDEKQYCVLDIIIEVGNLNNYLRISSGLGKRVMFINKQVYNEQELYSTLKRVFKEYNNIVKEDLPFHPSL